MGLFYGEHEWHNQICGSGTSWHGSHRLNVTGIGSLNNIRKVSGNNGELICAVINALTGPTDNASYTRFDITVAGKESVSLINRCQKAVDEEKQVLIGFVLTGLVADVFILTKGDMPVKVARHLKPD